MATTADTAAATATASYFLWFVAVVAAGVVLVGGEGLE
jgi:hypothetical protein